MEITTSFEKLLDGYIRWYLTGHWIGNTTISEQEAVWLAWEIARLVSIVQKNPHIKYEELWDKIHEDNSEPRDRSRDS